MTLFDHLLGAYRISRSGSRYALLSPGVKQPYFDDTLNAWVLTRYDDVTSAFRSEALCPVAPLSNGESSSQGGQKHNNFRRDTASSLSPLALHRWQGELVVVGSGLLARMVQGRSADLMDRYARPLCEHAAASVTGIGTSNGRRANQLAAIVSAAAAEPFDLYLGWKAKRAGKQLTTCFSSGADPLRVAGFVGISRTLPSLLGTVWLALLRQPAQWNQLHEQPDLIRSAVDELLRHSGLTQALFRVATDDCRINGVAVRKGERVVLKTACANKDPERFSMPETLDLSAKRAPHVALGFAHHSCVAAPLIRMIVGVSTRLLTQRLPSLRLIEDVRWSGGSGFRFPTALNVAWNASGADR